MNHKTEIDLVLPCYNPPHGWEQQVIAKFGETEARFETIGFRLFIVSDGSRHGYEPETVAALKQAIPHVQIIDYRPNRGKGYALREAVRHCQADYTIYTDYDFPYTDQSFRRVVDALLGGADVVVAVRDKNYQRSLPPFRHFLSISSHLCNKLFLGLKISDTQGGLKGFNRAGREVFLSTHVNSFLFDTEFIFKAQRLRMHLQAVPSQIREGIQISDMGVGVLRREIKNFFSILFNK